MKLLSAKGWVCYYVKLNVLFSPGPDSQQPAVPKMADIVEEEMSRNFSRPRPQVVLDAFYEGLHSGSQVGKLRVSFDSYANFRNDGSVDDVTLKLLKKHYENAVEAEMNDKDQLDWQILADLLVNLTVAEDCTLGLSLILTELRHRTPQATRQILEDPRMSTFVLYAASLDAMLPMTAEKTFEAPPGLLYATAKKCHEEKSVQSETFKTALEIAEVD